MVVGSKQVVARRALTVEEKGSSSTFREILALQEVYMSADAERFSGLCVKHLTDKTTKV